MTKGRLLVLSGPSGVGKSTVIHELLKTFPDLFFSVSVTTREARPGEVEGRDYYFIPQEEYDKLLAENRLLEHAGYTGHNYGTPAGPVDRALARGQDVLLDIEPLGAFQIRRLRPEAVLVFLAAPSFAELERRLRTRGDTSNDDIEKRLERAKWEYAQAPRYDYILCNEQVERAAAELCAIMNAEGCRAGRRLDFVKLDEAPEAGSAR